jgi:hypothetical protein
MKLTATKMSVCSTFCLFSASRHIAVITLDRNSLERPLSFSLPLHVF